MKLVLVFTFLSGSLSAGAPNSVIDLERKLKLAVRALDSQGPSADLSDALADLAAFYFTERDYARAENLSRRSLDIEEASLEPRPAEVARRLNNIAAALVARGKATQAEPFVERSLSIYSRLPRNSETAFAWNTAAVLELRAHRYEAAAKHFEQVVSLWRGDPVAQRKGMANLAAAYAGLGRFAESIATYQNALNGLDESDAIYGAILCDYSKALASAGRKQESVDAHKRARVMLDQARTRTAYTVDVSEFKAR